jgi:hypothetical protein
MILGAFLIVDISPQGYASAESFSEQRLMTRIKDSEWLGRKKL